MRGLIVASLILTGSISAWAEQIPLTPDPEITTGDYCTRNDPNFDGYRYEERIPYCRRAVSKGRKQQIYQAYDIPERCKHNYTVDHFIPLSMGGSNAPENLWPEHKKIKATRQTLEQELYNQLRNGEITRDEAVAVILDAKMNPPPVTEDEFSPEGCAK